MTDRERISAILARMLIEAEASPHEIVVGLPDGKSETVKVGYGAAEIEALQSYARDKGIMIDRSLAVGEFARRNVGRQTASLRRVDDPVRLSRVPDGPENGQ